MLAILLSLSITNCNNLNGDIYSISNPNLTSKKSFPTIYKDIADNMEYFDVYSDPISSRYGDVYWTMMNPVLLSSNIRNRFNDKIMAITGYEMDQVVRTPSGDISIPITLLLFVLSTSTR